MKIQRVRERVVVRSGGDIATGTIFRLHQCGYRVLVLETSNPTAIRRTVSFSQAIFDGEMEIEDVVAVRCESLEDAQHIIEQNKIPVMVDSEGKCIPQYKPKLVVDGILAKKNLGTSKDMAPIVVGLGPGFYAGKDVHAVIETHRGHELGRVIYEGPALPNTGIPGVIGGRESERVNYSPADGKIIVYKDIESLVKEGEVIASVEGKPVVAQIDGMVRGMIQHGTTVFKGMKIADVDPRGEKVNCKTISDKARSIAGGVLEAFLHLDLKIK